MAGIPHSTGIQSHTLLYTLLLLQTLVKQTHIPLTIITLTITRGNNCFEALHNNYR